MVGQSKRGVGIKKRIPKRLKDMLGSAKNGRVITDRKRLQQLTKAGQRQHREIIAKRAHINKDTLRHSADFYRTRTRRSCYRALRVN